MFIKDLKYKITKYIGCNGIKRENHNFNQPERNTQFFFCFYGRDPES